MADPFTRWPRTSPNGNPQNTADEKQATNASDNLRALNLATLDCKQLWRRILVRHGRYAVTTKPNQQDNSSEQPYKMRNESHGVADPFRNPTESEHFLLATVASAFQLPWSSPSIVRYLAER
jgi:hypothetical protein